MSDSVCGLTPDDVAVAVAEEAKVTAEAEAVAREVAASALKKALTDPPPMEPTAASGAAAPAASKPSKDWGYLLVTERFWKYVVIGHDDEALAKKHAEKLWSCWVLFKRDQSMTSPPGVYTEVKAGGVSAPLTFGKVHPKIRNYVSQNVGRLTRLARRASYVIDE